MKSKKIGMQALKIAIGSSLAIYIANLFGLKYSLAAGSACTSYDGDYKVENC
ncbi:MAG: aromatic acid exporter family protein [Coprococcus sp.]